MTKKRKPGDADDEPEDPYEAAWQLLQDAKARDQAKGGHTFDDLLTHEQWQAWAETKRREDAQRGNRPNQAPQTFGSYEAWKNRHNLPPGAPKLSWDELQEQLRKQHGVAPTPAPAPVEEVTFKQGLLEAAKGLLIVIMLPFVGGGMILLWFLAIAVAGLIFWGAIYLLALVAGIPIAPPE